MFDKILKLTELGFTPEQIMQLITAADVAAADAPASSPDPAAVSPAPPAPPAANEKPAAPAVTPGGSGAGIDGAAVTAAIEQMGRNIIAALQKAQIGGTSAPAPADPMAKIDAITAQIINPTRKKEE